MWDYIKDDLWHALGGLCIIAMPALFVWFIWPADAPPAGETIIYKSMDRVPQIGGCDE